MNHDHSSKHEHQITPLKVYFMVWGALLFFTVVTVASSYIDFGQTNNIMIAMVIATIKALLVTLFFMGLKYEGLENNATFFCTFAFLAIFVGLTSADLFYRVDTQPMHVVDDGMGDGGDSGGGPVDLKALVSPTPELLSKGKTLFSQQCMTCHGAEGKGDGPAAAALNPKPRNFTASEGWKNGRELSKVFKTLAEGIPGSPMPSFSAISVDDRMALAHYVRSLGAAAPAVTAADQSALQAMVGGGAKKKRIPIGFALDLMSTKQ